MVGRPEYERPVAPGPPWKPTGAPVLLHPDDNELWSLTYSGRKPDGATTRWTRTAWSCR